MLLADIQGHANITDDILVFGKTPKEHHEALMAVLKRLEENGFTVNLEKSEFCKNVLTFFGMRFTPQGISPKEFGNSQRPTSNGSGTRQNRKLLTHLSEPFQQELVHSRDSGRKRRRTRCSAIEVTQSIQKNDT